MPPEAGGSGPLVSNSGTIVANDGSVIISPPRRATRSTDKRFDVRRFRVAFVVNGEMLAVPDWPIRKLMVACFDADVSGRTALVEAIVFEKVVGGARHPAAADAAMI